MKAGDTVIFNDKGWVDFTFNKKYYVIRTTSIGPKYNIGLMFWLVDDKGHSCWIESEVFKSLKEVRKEKLKNIENYGRIKKYWKL